MEAITETLALGALAVFAAFGSILILLGYFEGDPNRKIVKRRQPYKAVIKSGAIIDILVFILIAFISCQPIVISAIFPCSLQITMTPTGILSNITPSRTKTLGPVYTVTKTPTPTITNTPSPSPTETKVIIFTDQFNDNSNNWIIGKRPGSHPVYTDIRSGKLIYSLLCPHELGVNYCSELIEIPSINVKNFDIEFTYSIVKNDFDNGIYFGIKYRSKNSYYLLLIDNKGYIDLQLTRYYSSTNEYYSISLFPKIKSKNVILDLEGVNKIELIINEQRHTLIINGVEEFTIEDKNLNYPGTISFYSSILDGGKGEIDIDNLLISQ